MCNWKAFSDEEIVERMSSLGVFHAGTQSARYKPLLLLFLLGRLRRGDERLVCYRDLNEALSTVMEEYRMGERAEVRYPFWHLQSEGFWEISNLGVIQGNIDEKEDRRRPTATFLKHLNPYGGFERGLFDRLVASPFLVGRVVQAVLDRHFPADESVGILESVKFY